MVIIMAAVGWLAPVQNQRMQGRSTRYVALRKTGLCIDSTFEARESGVSSARRCLGVVGAVGWCWLGGLVTELSGERGREER